MFSQSTVISSLGLLTAMATAATIPSDTTWVPACDGRVLVEKWGHVVAQPSWNSSRFGTFMGCEDKTTALSKRDDYDTTVESNDDSANANYVDGDTKPYDDLWNRAVAELCGNTYCDGDKSISTSSGAEPADTLVLSLDGNFADSTLRDNYISLIKDAFYKSVMTTKTEIGIDEDVFIGFAHATSGYGDASGFELTMRMSDQTSDTGCPAFINTINSFGALVPDLGPVFGVAGAVCGAAS